MSINKKILSKKPTLNIMMNDIQWSLITKILCSAQNSFDKENEKEYYSNANFLCVLTVEEHEELQKMIK